MFELYGRAAYFAQVLEEQLLNAISTKDSNRPVEGVLIQEARLRKKPLSQLIPEWSKTEPVHETVTQFLDQVRKKRDYLIHRFFREHALAKKGSSNYEAEIAELKTIMSELQLAWNLVEVLKSIRNENGAESTPEP